MNVTNVIRRETPVTKLVRLVSGQTSVVQPPVAVTRLLLNRHPVNFFGQTGNGGGSGGPASGSDLAHVATRSYSAGRLVALMGEDLVYYDAANPAHLFAFLGVTLNAANEGEGLQIRTAGRVRLAGWGLLPNHIYHAGLMGQLVAVLPLQAAFSQVIGRAIDAETLLLSPQNLYVNG